MGGHQQPNQGRSDEWLTPPDIVNDLGPFDLDPASPIKRPWSTAGKHFTRNDDGLSKKWKGRVWLNPPYGRAVGRWMERLVEHNNGIALIFARTETKDFHDYVWDAADAVFFFAGRLYFHRVDGSKAKANGGAPSVLVAYGAKNVKALRAYRARPGRLIEL